MAMKRILKVSAPIGGILPAGLLTLGKALAGMALLSLNRSHRSIFTSRNFVASMP